MVINKEHKIGIALVKEACRLCGTTYDGPILMNRKLSVSMARKVEAMNGKVIGFLSEPCDQCKDLMSKGLLIIGIIGEKTDDKNNPWRSGHQWVLCMDKAREIFTEDVCDKGVAFMDISFAKSLGLPVADITPKAEL